MDDMQYLGYFVAVVIIVKYCEFTWSLLLALGGILGGKENLQAVNIKQRTWGTQEGFMLCLKKLLSCFHKAAMVRTKLHVFVAPIIAHLVQCYTTGKRLVGKSM